jgi:aromatase
MPRVQARIAVQRPPREVFEITNDIDRWNVLFKEYAGSEVLERQDAGRFTKLVFRLKNNEGQEWVSWRILDHQDLVAIAERQEPLYPFVYMHLKWLYEPLPDGGTLMNWVQDFEMDPRHDAPREQVIAYMERHGAENQARIKSLLESGAVTVRA